MYCMRCGKEIKDDDKFCVSCGSPTFAKEETTDTKERVKLFDKNFGILFMAGLAASSIFYLIFYWHIRKASFYESSTISSEIQRSMEIALGSVLFIIVGNIKSIKIKEINLYKLCSEIVAVSLGCFWAFFEMVVVFGKAYDIVEAAKYLLLISGICLMLFVVMCVRLRFKNISVSENRLVLCCLSMVFNACFYIATTRNSDSLDWVFLFPLIIAVIAGILFYKYRP